MEYALSTLDHVVSYAAEAEIVTWQGHQALKLVNGLAVIDDLTLSEGWIEVTIGTDGAAYPGIAFRVADRANYELGYVQPHTSGQWDAIQYDPVFHGSNTWQIYHGAAYQKQAVVPTGQWFTLRADITADQLALTVDDQPPLIVPRLMHPSVAGRVGIWTYLPAYFRDLRVSETVAFPAGEAEPFSAVEGSVDAWFVEGFGRVTCEANGILNLNRFLPLSAGHVTLTRRFEIASGCEVALSFGFSDELTLRLDGDTVFEGSCTFSNQNSYEARGYIRPDQQTVSRSLTPGVHTLAAELKVTEPFGWGLAVAIQGAGITLLPVV